MVHLMATLCGLAGILFFILARQDREYPVLFLLQMVVLVDFMWPMDGGGTGSDAFFFLTILLYPPVVFRGKMRWIMSGLVILNICGMFAFEYCHPEYIFHFPNHAEALFDCFISLICSSVALTMVMLIITTCYDVEEKRLANKADELNNSEENYRKVVETAQCIILRLDGTGRILFLNKFARDLFGFNTLEITGRSALGCIMPQVSTQGEDLTAEFGEMLRQPGSYDHFQRESVCQDGRRIWISWANVPKYDDQGRLSELLCVGTDLTEVKENEEKRRQQELKVQHLKRMETLGQLAGGIAHDFNNILGAIIIQTELTGDLKDLPDHAKDDLKLIRESAERAANLTRQLLLFSRKQVMQPCNLDLNGMVTNITKMLRRIIGEDIIVELRLHPTPVLTHADPGMMDQILMNLTLNSRDAMPEGGNLVIETGTLSLGDDAAQYNPEAVKGDYVSLSVTDSGCGISPEIQSKIFEPFFTTKEVGKGTGLGLATVYGIVKQHRGFIGFSSTPGSGSSFHIYLPAVNPIQTAGSAKLDHSLNRDGSGTILLVEDDSTMRFTTQVLLKKNGYQIFDAENGVEAMALWEKHHDQIDLLITDMVMPAGISGLQLADKLKSLNPGLRIIIMSGYSMELAGKEFTDSSSVKFLYKPFSTDIFLQTIRQALEGKSVLF